MPRVDSPEYRTLTDMALMPGLLGTLLHANRLQSMPIDLKSGFQATIEQAAWFYELPYTQYHETYKCVNAKLVKQRGSFCALENRAVKSPSVLIPCV